MKLKNLNKNAFLVFIIIGMGIFNIHSYYHTKDISKENKIYADINSKLTSQLSSQECIILQQNNIILKHEKEICTLSETVDELSKIIDSNNNISKISYLGKFTLSFYSKEQFPGKTAIGTYGQAGITIAADPNIIPLGTQVYIEGYGFRYVQDTGGAIKGNKIDVFVETTEEAIQLGRKENVDIWIIE